MRVIKVEAVMEYLASLHSDMLSAGRYSEAHTLYKAISDINAMCDEQGIDLERVPEMDTTAEGLTRKACVECEAVGAEITRYCYMSERRETVEDR